jgi:predicted DsbA family dithiol-disulfide isomerase
MRSRYGAEVTWLPFDLHPEFPPEGITREQLLQRYGPGMTAHVRAMFERAGLVYNPHPELVPNTRTALRLAEHARDRGLHEPVHNRLMDAYWNEGKNLGDPDTLRELAAEAGLSDVDGVFDGDAYAGRVRASTTEAQSIGITGIPAFLLDGRLLVLGAQPREVFGRAFERLEAES